MRALDGRAGAPVSSQTTRERRSWNAGWAAVAILAVVAALHVYWALGGDWAAATAWGSTDLPPAAATWIVVLLLTAAIAVVLGRMGLWGRRLPGGVFRVAAWALVVVFAVVALQNVASGLNEQTYGREWALFFIAPLVVVLAFLCAIVARSAPSR